MKTNYGLLFVWQPKTGYFCTFGEIDPEIISTVILLLPLIQDIVSYKQKYELVVLVDHLVKFAQEKSADRLNMNIAVDWDVKPQTKQTKQKSPQSVYLL